MIPSTRYVYEDVNEAEHFLNGFHDYTHIPLPTDNNSKTGQNQLRTTPPPCWWFYKDCDYDGQQLVAQLDHNFYATAGLNNCTHFWSHDDLTYRPMSGTDISWDDQISSWALDRSVCMGHSIPTVGIMKIVVYRHNHFPGWTCAREGWTIDVPNFNKHCLVNNRWCWLGATLNDRISSYRMVICKLECDECFSILDGER